MGSILYRTRPWRIDLPNMRDYWQVSQSFVGIQLIFSRLEQRQELQGEQPNGEPEFRLEAWCFGKRLPNGPDIQCHLRTGWFIINDRGICALKLWKAGI